MLQVEAGSIKSSVSKQKLDWWKYWISQVGAGF